MNRAEISRAAAFLSGALGRRKKLAQLPEDCRPETLVDAYAIQDQFVKSFGGAPVGYKVACTNVALQQMLNTDAPFSGRLISGRVYDSPAVIDPASMFQIGIETEYAFRMGEDLSPVDAPYRQDRIAAAVSELIPAIEIVDSRYEDWSAVGVLQLIADNALGAHWVAGESFEDWRTLDIVEHELVTSVNGEVAATGKGANVLGHPLESLAWLANDLASLGLGLKEGDYVTTGSCTPLVRAHAGDVVSADFGPLGSIEVTFASA